MWKETKQGLYKKFTFDDFAQAFAFMTRIAAVAEERQHHPRWTNEWNTVEVWLRSHDADDSITAKDRELAEVIDTLVQG